MATKRYGVELGKKYRFRLTEPRGGSQTYRGWVVELTDEGIVTITTSGETVELTPDDWQGSPREVLSPTDTSPLRDYEATSGASKASKARKSARKGPKHPQPTGRVPSLAGVPITKMTAPELRKHLAATIPERVERAIKAELARRGKSEKAPSRALREHISGRSRPSAPEGFEVVADDDEEAVAAPPAPSRVERAPALPPPPSELPEGWEVVDEDIPAPPPGPAARSRRQAPVAAEEEPEEARRFEVGMHIRFKGREGKALRGVITELADDGQVAVVNLNRGGTSEVLATDKWTDISEKAMPERTPTEAEGEEWTKGERYTLGKKMMEDVGTGRLAGEMATLRVQDAALDDEAIAPYLPEGAEEGRVVVAILNDRVVNRQKGLDVIFRGGPKGDEPVFIPLRKQKTQIISSLRPSRAPWPEGVERPASNLSWVQRERGGVHEDVSPGLSAEELRERSASEEGIRGRETRHEAGAKARREDTRRRRLRERSLDDNFERLADWTNQVVYVQWNGAWEHVIPIAMRAGGMEVKLLGEEEENKEGERVLITPEEFDIFLTPAVSEKEARHHEEFDSTRPAADDYIPAEPEPMLQMTEGLARQMAEDRQVVADIQPGEAELADEVKGAPPEQLRDEQRQIVEEFKDARMRARKAGWSDAQIQEVFRSARREQEDTSQRNRMVRRAERDPVGLSDAQKSFRIQRTLMESSGIQASEEQLDKLWLNELKRSGYNMKQRRLPPRPGGGGPMQATAMTEPWAQEAFAPLPEDMQGLGGTALPGMAPGEAEKARRMFEPPPSAPPPAQGQVLPGMGGGPEFGDVAPPPMEMAPEGLRNPETAHAMAQSLQSTASGGGPGIMDFFKASLGPAGPISDIIANLLSGGGAPAGPAPVGPVPGGGVPAPVPVAAAGLPGPFVSGNFGAGRVTDPLVAALVDALGGSNWGEVVNDQQNQPVYGMTMEGGPMPMGTRGSMASATNQLMQLLAALIPGTQGGLGES